MHCETRKISISNLKIGFPVNLWRDYLGAISNCRVTRHLIIMRTLRWNWHHFLDKQVCSATIKIMGRRPREWQASSSMSASYGLTTILMAGLVFVDSFHLFINPSPRHHLAPNGEARAVFQPTSSRSQRCNSCRTSMDSSCDCVPSSSLNRRKRTVDLRVRLNSPRCVTAATLCSATKLAHDSPTQQCSAVAAEAEAEALRVRNAPPDAESTGAPARERGGGGVADMPVSRGQMLSAFAALGAATLMVGSSPAAVYSLTGVRTQRIMNPFLVEP